MSGREPIPMVGVEDRLQKRSTQRGEMAGREVELVFSEEQVEDSFAEIERLLETTYQASDFSEKGKALFQTRHHLTLLMESLQQSGITRPEKRQEREEQGGASFEERVGMIVRRVLDAERAVRDEMAHEEQQLHLTLSAACAQALVDDNPIAVVQTAFAMAEKFYGEDFRFGQLLHSLRLVVSAFQASALQTKRVLVPFLQKVLFDGPQASGFSFLAAHEMAAELLLVADHGVVASLPGVFDDEGCSVLKERASEILKRQKQDVEARISQAPSCYKSENVRATLFPQAVAAALVCHDGTLNLGLISLVKAIFLHPKGERDAMERHIVSSMKELQGDQSLVYAMEKTPLLVDPEAIEDVNCLLQRRLDTPVSRGDALCAVLTTFFTWWRQGGCANCFLVASGALRRESLGLWMVEDIRELLTQKRTLTRIIDGIPVTALALPLVFKEVVMKKMSAEDISSLFQCPSVKYACELLGCTTEEELKQLAQEMCSKDPSATCTVLDIFTTLCQRHAMPSERLFQAIRVVESQSQNVVVGLWMNAMGGFLSPPISASHVPLHLSYPRGYFVALMKASLAHARRLGLRDIEAKLCDIAACCQAGGGDSLAFPPNAIPPAWSRLRVAMIPERYEDFDLSFALMYEDPVSGQQVPLLKIYTNVDI